MCKIDLHAREDYKGFVLAHFAVTIISKQTSEMSLKFNQKIPETALITFPLNFISIICIHKYSDFSPDLTLTHVRPKSTE